MSKTVLFVIGSVVILVFLFLHFEWFPAHTAPDRATARTEVTEWARAVSGQNTPDVKIERVHILDDSGVASVEVAVHNLYYEARGTGRHYSGRARVDFVRVGRMFQPRWAISRVTLLDQNPPVLLPVSTSSRATPPLHGDPSPAATHTGVARSRPGA